VNVVFFDCYSGAAGDMLLAALIDAGAPEDAVRDSLDALRLPAWELHLRRVTSGGIAALRAEVVVGDHEPHRSYRDVREVIESADLNAGVKERALHVFARLAEAEAKVHGTEKEDVVFHEVGATDALIDVVGVASAIEHFSPSLVAASAVATGTGTVATHHGDLPLPAPAVAELLKGVPVFGRGREELVTPTGAAILTELCSSFGDLPAMTLDAVGHGAGGRQSESPNVVRALIGRLAAEDERETALMIETNIDDLNPELVPYIIDRLLESGAHDAWTNPIVMKKGRLATTLSVLCDHGARDKVIEIIFAETTTLGLRCTPVTKHTLHRELITVDIDGHAVRVKIGRRAGEALTIAPEYEDARAVARVTGVPLKEIYAHATEAARAATLDSR
jgi:pyridinium-3,5-bisthiocarboxylic acid mononucleotide nickel chelatase